MPYFPTGFEVTTGAAGATDVNLIQVGGAAIALGQALMASSIPVVIASNQSTLPVAVIGLVDVTGSVVAIAGTVTVAGIISTKTDLTPASPTFATVGVASALAVAANAARKGLILVNTSNRRISLGFGSVAVLDSGITLFSGDSFSMDEYSFDVGSVNAIASGAGANLAIQEFST